MAEFLFEIGLEEIPARMIASAEAELQQRVVAMLERERLVSAGVASKSFATPRRLAVWVAEVAERQQDITEELVGPSVKVAFKDGVPTPAAEAFAKKAGVAVSSLKTVTTPKGEYIAASSTKQGLDAADVIVSELPKELAAIYWAKNMYWRPGRPERFVRPVRWMAALLGAKPVKVSFGGYEAGSVTYGHRVLFGDEPIALKLPGEYEQTLEKSFVVADVAVRRHKIRKALDAVTRTVAEARWREDEDLVETVTQLTEWPSVIMGSFETEYLALPEEVLVTVMRDHQKYFAVEDKAGKLAPHFLAVLNTEADEAGLAVIRHGNERVLRARFNDARFFWEFDQRVSLADRVELLKNVTFQKDLGSYAAKTARVRKLASNLAGLVLQRKCELNPVALDEAVSLAKTDLTSELVKEFTELQGIVGGLYARAQGLSAAAADAIYDQYKPVSMEDSVPRTVEGAVLAMADKADTIAGMFGLGMEPTGSKDPFALRRAANGIVKVLAETTVALPLTLTEVAAAACGQNEALTGKVRGFLAERLEFYLREARGQAYDVVKAVLAAGADDVRDAVARAEAVTAVRGSDDFAAVSAAFRRMKNILAQAAEKSIAPGAHVEDALLAEASEKALAQRSSELAARVASLRAEKNYKAALESIATLRPQVDAFFDGVMVMVPEPEVRANRLALLTQVLGDFSGIADFSEIVTAG
ncbi:glycine--tRNA ligase subunit beta [Edaphobacter dinghuensis]|uniref:Glycine--tRNA ligase beta subunit n=1 Tax=Edaphobacter dinghuensis TaxID=1560005 RepID=A0A917HII3_9BACT|nr:glycine--tRNA ligase subunit beta [Edaphobacter dinghuensis]GGG80772.1 glycine--tRNA ligase beta subunit [Edaphobacter dinghuensis]